MKRVRFSPVYEPATQEEAERLIDELDGAWDEVYTCTAEDGRIAAVFGQSGSIDNKGVPVWAPEDLQ